MLEVLAILLFSTSVIFIMYGFYRENKDIMFIASVAFVMVLTVEFILRKTL